MGTSQLVLFLVNSVLTLGLSVCNCLGVVWIIITTNGIKLTRVNLGRVGIGTFV